MQARLTGAPGAEWEPQASGLAWHTLSVERVLRAVEVDAQRGLSSGEAAARAGRFGPNMLAAGRAEPGWLAFIRQYSDPMQIVLLAAGVLSLFPLRQLGTGILLILLTLGNAVLGLQQEGKAASQRRCCWPAWWRASPSRACWPAAPATTRSPVAGPATGLPSAIIAHAAAAGITVTTRPAADRAAAVSLVESGAASAAVAGTRELIWDKTADNRLAPILTRALNEIAIAQRASAMGLTPAQAGDLLAAAGTTVTRLHPQPDRGPQRAAS